MRAALATPGFRRLYTGLAASILGDALMLIVLSVWVKVLTGSNGAAGLTFLWMTAPALLAPLFGYVVDRVSRRSFLVVGNVVSGLMMLPLLLVHDADDVWIIYAVAFGYGISFVVLPAALNGLLKDLLPEEVLVEANASLSVTREAFRLVGPLVGAGAFSVWGGGVVAVLDAVTFLLAAVAVAGVRVQETGRDTSAEPQSWRAELSEGGRHIRRTPLLLHATLSLGIALLVIGFAESGIYALTDAFDKPATFVGPLLSTQGMGAICSGLVASRVVRRYGEPWTVAIGLGLTGLGLAGLTVSTEVWQLFLGAAVLGAGIPLMIVAFTTLLQRQTPARLIGRVSTTVEVFTTSPQAVGIAIGAGLVSLVSFRVLFGLMTLGTWAAAVYLLVALRGRMRGGAGGEDLSAEQEAAGRARTGGETGVDGTIPGTVLPEPITVVPPLPLRPEDSSPGDGHEDSSHEDGRHESVRPDDGRREDQRRGR